MENVLDAFLHALACHKNNDLDGAANGYNRLFETAADARNLDVQCIAAVCRRFLYHYCNGTRADNLMNRNGEMLLLERLASQGAKIIFDVGANIGYWALAAAHVNGAATIHSFEIFDETYVKLALNTAGHSRIVINGFGLGDRDGMVDVHCADGLDSAHFSTINRFENGRPHPCPLKRGDAYMTETGIEHIDFLKIDVEGGEYAVLAGFADALTAGRIAVIQFEYGPASLTSRKLLKDYYDLLSGYGYIIGRLHAQGVNFKEYNLLEDENFINANFIACLDTRSDLHQAIALR